MAHDKEPIHDLEQRFFALQARLQEQLGQEANVVIASRREEGSDKEEKLVLHSGGWVIVRGDHAFSVEHSTPLEIMKQFASLTDAGYQSIEGSIDHADPYADYPAWDRRLKIYLQSNRRVLLTSLVTSMDTVRLTESPAAA